MFMEIGYCHESLDLRGIKNDQSDMTKRVET